MRVAISRGDRPRLYAMLAACAALLLVFAVPRAAQARHRLARLFRAQEEWAEMMDRHAQPPSAIALPTEDPGGADEPQDVENPIYAPPIASPRAV
jgi:hypothetical protein